MRPISLIGALVLLVVLIATALYADPPTPRTVLVPIAQCTYRTPYGTSPYYCTPPTYRSPATCQPKTAPPQKPPPFTVNLEALKRELRQELTAELRRALAELPRPATADEIAAAAAAKIPRPPSADEIARRALELIPGYIDVRVKDELTGEAWTRRVPLGQRVTLHHHPPEIITRPPPGRD